MPALTPQVVMDLESRMQVIAENEAARITANLWYQNIVTRRETTNARDILTWLLSTAQIRDEGPVGGNIHFDDLLATTTQFEHRFSGGGLKLLRQQFEDTDGAAFDLAGQWQRDITAQALYWPQKQTSWVLKNGHTASLVTGYDGKAFFATDHPVNPFRPAGPSFANLLTGAQNGAYPGALPIHDAVPVETALRNLQRLNGYVAGIKMPDGETPRYLRLRALLVPPTMTFRAVQLTSAKFIAQSAANGAAASSDVEALIRALGLTVPIQIDELSGFEDDTTYFAVAEQLSTSQLGGIVFTERDPYKIRYYGYIEEAELDRKDELEWHCKGRNGIQPGHPYLLFKIKAT